MLNTTMIRISHRFSTQCCFTCKLCKHTRRETCNHLELRMRQNRKLVKAELAAGNGQAALNALSSGTTPPGCAPDQYMQRYMRVQSTVCTHLCLG